MGNKSKISLIGYKGYRVDALKYSPGMEDLLKRLEVIRRTSMHAPYTDKIKKILSEAIKESFSDTPNKRIKLK